MLSSTPSIFVKTSLSQNLKTSYPCSSNHLSLNLSFLFSKCCPPSTSIIIFLSRFTKSAIYFPIRCWRRNLKPSNCLPLKYFHKYFSVSVELFLSFLAIAILFFFLKFVSTFFHPHLNPPPSRGRSCCELGSGFYFTYYYINCYII